MKSLRESLFDTDLVSSTLTTLYDLFGSHIKKFKHSYSTGLGWTHFFSQTNVVREWKKEGRPELKGSFAKTTFPPDLQKFIALILKNTIVTKKQLLDLPEDGELDSKILNDKFEKYGIIFPEDSKWGSTDTRTLIGVQVTYIDGLPASSDHGVQFNQIGYKEFKGLNTENIEIHIYVYDSSKYGWVRNTWVLLTDLTTKDIK